MIKISLTHFVGQNSIHNLTLRKEIFPKSGFPGNFTKSCFKTFWNNVQIIEEKFPIVKEEPLMTDIVYPRNILLQTRTK